MPLVYVPGPIAVLSGVVLDVVDDVSKNGANKGRAYRRILIKTLSPIDGVEAGEQQIYVETELLSVAEVGKGDKIEFVVEFDARQFGGRADLTAKLVANMGALAGHSAGF